MLFQTQGGRNATQRDGVLVSTTSSQPMETKTRGDEARRYRIVPYRIVPYRTAPHRATEEERMQHRNQINCYRQWCAEHHISLHHVFVGARQTKHSPRHDAPRHAICGRVGKYEHTSIGCCNAMCWPPTRHDTTRHDTTQKRAKTMRRFIRIAHLSLVRSLLFTVLSCFVSCCVVSCRAFDDLHR